MCRLDGFAVCDVVHLSDLNKSLCSFQHRMNISGVCYVCGFYGYVNNTNERVSEPYLRGTRARSEGLRGIRAFKHGLSN